MPVIMVRSSCKSGRAHCAREGFQWGACCLRAKPPAGGCGVKDQVNRVLVKLEKQIHRHRTRLEKRLREGAFRHDEPVFEDALAVEDQGQVIRTKRFAIKPMLVEEAIMQMDLLGHSFFVFTNSQSDEVNVVYRRKDGNYGLIEPEYD